MVPDWVGVVVRGWCGAVFGAMLGAGEVLYFIDKLDRIVSWSIFGGCVVGCAFLAIRYGDDFWASLRDWIGPRL